MNFEVVVVGGGIGGLTTAALLAARGVTVCLLERQPVLGGCVTPVEKFGFHFENSLGIYASWRPGEIHDRIFAELPVEQPTVQQLEPAYVVRLPDQTDVKVSSDSEAFFQALRTSFPECAGPAIDFYREAELLGTTLLQAASRVPDLRTAGRLRQWRSLWPSLGTAARIRASLKERTDRHLVHTSARFRSFVDAQLQLLAQCSSDECAYPYACVALTLRRQGLFAMAGGAATLINLLAQSITSSGGAIRLNAPVLRCAYDSRGYPTGVMLLNGETIFASRAIVSNLTVWDTYGKLIGLQQTPLEIRTRLKTLSGWGAYLIYAGMAEQLASRLPANHLVAAAALGTGAYDPTTQLNIGIAPGWDPRGPTGRRAVLIHTFTHADEWFTFHEGASELEEKDQTELESVWRRLHARFPELGDAIEVIDTATPQTCYADTRRKLGMVGGLGQSIDVFGANSISHRSIFANLFLVGDTSFPGAGLAAVSQGALVVANEICG